MWDEGGGAKGTEQAERWGGGGENKNRPTLRHTTTTHPHARTDSNTHPINNNPSKTCQHGRTARASCHNPPHEVVPHFPQRLEDSSIHRPQQHTLARAVHLLHLAKVPLPILPHLKLVVRTENAPVGHLAVVPLQLGGLALNVNIPLVLPAHEVYLQAGTIVFTHHTLKPAVVRVLCVAELAHLANSDEQHRGGGRGA
jgi:hypothetical protein